MLSKVRKHLKFLPQFFTVLGAVSMAFAMLLSVVNIPVSGQGQDTCPEGGDWIKVSLSSLSHTYTAPAGKLVAEWCYKAGNTVNTGIVNPPQSSVTVTSTVLNPQGNNFQNLSHASFRLVNIPTNTPPPPTPTFTATNTPVTPTATFTATNTPTNTPISPTATFTATNTPTNTPIPDDPNPTPTNTAVPGDPDPTTTPVPDETPDPTGTPVPDEPEPTEPPVTEETPEPTLAPPVSNDPPAVLIPVTGIELGGNSPLSDLQNFVFNLGLTFLGLGLILQSVRKRFNF